MPSASKFINNRNYRNANNSEPKKIISSSFGKLKAGVTYTGSLYNNRMESKYYFIEILYILNNFRFCT